MHGRRLKVWFRHRASAESTAGPDLKGDYIGRTWHAGSDLDYGRRLTCHWLPLPNLVQARLVGSGHPVHVQSGVNRFTVPAQRAKVCPVGLDSRCDPGAFGDGSVPGHRKVSVPGGFRETVQDLVVGIQRSGVTSATTSSGTSGAVSSAAARARSRTSVPSWLPRDT